MAINNDCSSKQTFCDIKGQTVNDISPLTYSGCITNHEYIDNEAWNEMIKKIIEIYNYGDKGTRDPKQIMDLTMPANSQSSTSNGHEYQTNTDTISNYNSIIKNNYDFVNLIDYNNLLTTISQSNINENILITGDVFSNLISNINNYEINSDRCDNCNVACNTVCEDSSQCYCDCYGSCYSSGGSSSPASCERCYVLYSSGGSGQCYTNPGCYTGAGTCNCDASLACLAGQKSR